MSERRSLTVPSLAKVLADNEAEQARREASPTYNQPPWAEPDQAYVTEIWCPESDNGIQHLHSPMPEPEPFIGPETAREYVNGLIDAALAREDPEPEAETEADDWYCADYDAEAAEYDVEPEAGL
jgi:hypothetical protein